MIKNIIVIGSGMGGMTTAAMLSKLGKKVLVLEQHYIPGGFTHTFKRKGYEWDVGVHAVGWTLSGEPFANTAFEIDEIVQNWIKFISAPILGVLLFYAARFSLETLNHGEDKILEES